MYSSCNRTNPSRDFEYASRSGLWKKTFSSYSRSERALWKRGCVEIWQRYVRSSVHWKFSLFKCILSYRCSACFSIKTALFIVIEVSALLQSINVKRLVVWYLWLVYAMLCFDLKPFRRKIVLVVLYWFNVNTTVNFCMCCEKQFPRRIGGGKVSWFINSALKSAKTNFFALREINCPTAKCWSVLQRQRFEWILDG